MKKLLSMILAIAMLMSLLSVVSVSAVDLPENVGTDYVANEATRYADNMWLDTYENMYVNSFNTTRETDTDRYMNASSSNAVSLPHNGKYNVPLSARLANVEYPAGATGRVVFSFYIKGTSGTPVVNMGRINTTIGDDTDSARAEYPVEEKYNSYDKGITPGSSYEYFKGTFADTGAAADKYEYYLGFANGTSLGAQFFMEKEKSYLAYERAYDMTIEASDTKLYAGGQITVSADIKNQIDKDFGGNTDVTWYVLNAERTAAIEGFTIEKNECGTYSVSVDETVEKGTYTLVGVADANKEIVKSIPVTVSDNPYVDYVADEETRYADNMWLDTYTNMYVNSFNTTRETDTERYMNASSTVAVSLPHNGKYNVPLSARLANVEYPAGATGRVVFSFYIRGTEGTPVVNMGRINTTIGDDTDSARAEYPVEEKYNSYDKGITPGSSYEYFKGTFADTGAAADKYEYYLGFANGTSLGAQFFMEREKSYLAYERAYDMEVTADAETVAQGGTVNVEAVVLNQIGDVYGDEVNITWKAMNTERTAEIDGITVENGVVTVADTVESGTYDIVAVLGDAVMAKGVSIEVTEATEEPAIEGITITKTAGGIKVSTDTALNNAQLIFATYEGGRLVAANIDTKVKLDAQGVQEYSIPAGFTSAKVMLWTQDFKPLTNVLN